jgi:amino acid transporter
MAVVAVLTGMVHYDRLDLNAPLADAFGQVGLGWAKLLIAFAGVAGITTVELVLLLSLPRILLAMARDGLLPSGSSPPCTRASARPGRRPWRPACWSPPSPPSCPSTSC